MNALFFFAGYDHRNNEWWRFAVATPDGPHDRFAVALDALRVEYPDLKRWFGQFVCLTPDEVFKEL